MTRVARGRVQLAAAALAAGCAGAPGAPPAPPVGPAPGAAPVVEAAPPAADAGVAAPRADAAPRAEASPSRDAQAEPGDSAPGRQDQEDAGAAAPGAGVAPLPAGTTVLHIGDSMAGALGIELDKRLKAAGVNALLHYKTASFIPQWAWGGEVQLLMAQKKPDLVIISLGANELMVPDPASRAGVIQRIVKEIGDRPCVWIGVPLWKGAKGDLLEVIHDNAGPCRFMDTTRIVGDMPRVSDHIHPTMNARVRWAKIVVDWLARQRDPHGAKPWQLLPEPPDAPPALLALPADQPGAGAPR